MSLSWILIIVFGSLFAVYLVSFYCRSAKTWSHDAADARLGPKYSGSTSRRGGREGPLHQDRVRPNLVLLHTLPAQLDLFERVAPDLAKSFTVWALDYPGHGHSDIPKARYDADFFVRAVGSFFDALDLRDVTLCGVSIGGAIALIAARRRNPRVARERCSIGMPVAMTKNPMHGTPSGECPRSQMADISCRSTARGNSLT